VVALLSIAICARGSFTEAVGRLRDLQPAPAVMAAACLLVTLAASAGAWRCALRSIGADLRYREAWGCYGLGSLANAALPARLGEAVRIGLFARRLPHSNRALLSGGACLAVAGSRAVVFVLFCVGGRPPASCPRGCWRRRSSSSL
jgi:uncharacterized membrane protein YbhN (UPF0104 family)